MKKINWVRGLVASAAVLLGLAGVATLNAQASVNSDAVRYTPAKITKYQSTFTVKINYRSGYGRPEGVIVHETAEPNWSAATGAKHFLSEWRQRGTFVHALVDGSAIDNIGNTNYGTWGVGAIGNNRFINVELCETTNRTAFVKSVNNLAYYTAYLLRQYNLKPDLATSDGYGTVWSHLAVTKFLGGTTHSDPEGYFQQWGYDMNQFYALTQTYYNKLSRVKAQTSAARANVVKLGASAKLRQGPSTNYRIIRTLKKNSSWKYSAVKVVRGVFWYQVGKNQWVPNGGLGKVSLKTTEPSSIRKGPGASFAYIKAVAKGKTYVYTDAKLVAGTLWYKVGASQWLANGVTGSNAAANGIIKIGKPSPMYKGAGTNTGLIRTLPAGSAWKYTKTAKIGNTTWYCLGGKQWVAK